VSFDTEAENKAFAEKFGFNYPLLCDVDRRVGVAYGAADSPQDGFARRVGVIIGPDGKIKDYQPKVSAQSYPKDALARI
jgi:peroxiredoxin Q/BCP